MFWLAGDFNMRSLPDTILVPTWPHFGPKKPPKIASWRPLGTSGGPLVASWRHRERVLDRLQPSLAISVASGALLKAS